MNKHEAILGNAPFGNFIVKNGLRIGIFWQMPPNDIAAFSSNYSQTNVMSVCTNRITHNWQLLHCASMPFILKLLVELVKWRNSRKSPLYYSIQPKDTLALGKERAEHTVFPLPLCWLVGKNANGSNQRQLDGFCGMKECIQNTNEKFKDVKWNSKSNNLSSSLQHFHLAYWKPSLCRCKSYRWEERT